MFMISGFMVRNIEICSVVSNNKIDLLVPANRVLRLQLVHNYAVPSRKVVDLLMLMNHVFRLRKDQM